VLNEAGFVRVEASASAESYGTPESTRKMGEMMADYMHTHLETAIQLNWIDATTVETLTAEWSLGVSIRMLSFVFFFVRRLDG